LPYIRFCICPLDHDYVLHIVNLAILYTDKASNNIVFVCKTHYYNCILNELRIGSAFGIPTYIPTAHPKDEILQSHVSVLDTFNIPVNGMDKYERPYLNWISKLRKNP
jgi:hypothetical protein